MPHKAQAWGFDLVAGVMIFLTGIIFFYFYSVNYNTDGEPVSKSLESEANLIAESLLSEGFPLDWTQQNVARIGFYDNGRVNETKLERFYDLTLTTSGYAKTKSLFNVKDDYYIAFSEEINIGGTQVSLIGVQHSPDAENVVKVTRVIIVNEKILTLEVFAWD